MKKIKLVVFLLVGCFGFFLSIHNVLADGCCQVGSSSCTKGVKSFSACTFLAKNDSRVFYDGEVNCDGPKSKQTCDAIAKKTAPLTTGTPTSTDPVGCCSAHVTSSSGGYQPCIPNVNQSVCAKSDGQFFVKDPTCTTGTAKGFCSAQEKGCCVYNGSCSANSSKTYCSGTNQTYIPNDTSCSSSQAKSACSSQLSPGQGQDPSATNTPGQDPSAGDANITFPNPLKYNNVNDFVTNILVTLRSIIVVLSIIFIVLGGIFYITSAGNEKRMTVAKGAITASMIGLAIGIAAPSFLKEIYTIMGGGTKVDTSLLNGSLTLTQIALNFLDFLLAIVGVLALIMLIIGGIMYLTSAGDDKRIETAKKIVTYSIIGIAIALASLVVVRQIANLLTQS